MLHEDELRRLRIAKEMASLQDFFAEREHEEASRDAALRCRQQAATIEAQRSLLDRRLD